MSSATVYARVLRLYRQLNSCKAWGYQRSAITGTGRLAPTYLTIVHHIKPLILSPLLLFTLLIIRGLLPLPARSARTITTYHAADHCSINLTFFFVSSTTFMLTENVDRYSNLQYVFKSR